MKSTFGRTGISKRRGHVVRLSGVIALLVASSGLWGAGITNAGTPSGDKAAQPEATCPSGGQCFADVTTANSFYEFINNLYKQDIVTGYACGGAGEPCDAQNRPYYRPGNTVNRQQMAKFVDNARNLPGVYMDADNNTQPFFIFGNASNMSNFISITNGGNATSLRGTANGSNGVGVYGSAVSASGYGVRASATGDYAAYINSSGYRGAYINSNSTSEASLYVDAGPSAGAAIFNAHVTVEGTLIVNGGCVGCGLAGIMQNVGAEALEQGDVVEVVGTAPAVVGANPVLLVRKATAAYDTGVIGVAGQALYVPSAETRAAYERQEADRKEAMARRDVIMDGDGSPEEKAAQLAEIVIPEVRVHDVMGQIHPDTEATGVAANAYGTLTSEGTIPAIKVTAANGPIHPGDLLVSSGVPGLAMKADPSRITPGVVIGKALGDLESGTGMVPVMITLK